jgi:Resolvase, N terminal domain
VNRPELAKALALCRKHKAKRVIAKLDRLSRNLAFIATMMDSGVEFVAVDNPFAATNFTDASNRPLFSSHSRGRGDGYKVILAGCPLAARPVAAALHGAQLS